VGKNPLAPAFLFPFAQKTGPLQSFHFAAAPSLLLCQAGKAHTGCFFPRFLQAFITP
jgi:hypothetical protein